MDSFSWFIACLICVVATTVAGTVGYSLGELSMEKQAVQRSYGTYSQSTMNGSMRFVWREPNER